MTGPFDAERVLQIAVELELTGQVFYEVIASGCGRGNQRSARLLTRLAAEEEDHGKTFQAMLEDLSRRTGRRPAPLTPEQEQRVRDLLQRQVLPDPAAVRAQAGQMSVEQALDLGVRMEVDSIAFYTGILLAVTDEADAETARQVIAEERLHEKELRNALKALGG